MLDTNIISDLIKDPQGKAAKRIAKWVEQGYVGPAKAKAMLKIEKVAKSEPIAKVAEPKAEEPDAP